MRREMQNKSQILDLKSKVIFHGPLENEAADRKD